jgi:lipid-A-disaccharide synthase
MNKQILSIGIVAGEESGDRLGAALIAEIKSFYPKAIFRGMAGPQMVLNGCTAEASITELSVMGLVEVVRNWPRLSKLRNRLVKSFVEDPPDVFIGIDVPDFNFYIEKKLKVEGIPTVHYVCPQIWAWREGRARKLRESTDRLLAIFPFEQAFFHKHGISTEFVGHPLARELPFCPNKVNAKVALGLDKDRDVLAIMPGSRLQELTLHLPVFVEAAKIVAKRTGVIQVVAGVVNSHHKEIAQAVCKGLGFDVHVRNSQELLTAADAAIVASGTVTLEALLCRTPMVVGYRMSPISYYFLKRLITIDKIALPNILSKSDLVPEYIQSEMTPENLSRKILHYLADKENIEAFSRSAEAIHLSLVSNTENAGDVVCKFIKNGR